MKAFFQKYKHAWVLLYGFIYLPWFFWLVPDLPPAL